jgi:curved DNA-binding protein CbpA
MAQRDPHQVLGLRPGATSAQIKAAWRRLARQHHPDLIGDDPAASRRATRRMAEINAAYESLRSGTRPGVRPTAAPGYPDRSTGRPAGPPPPPPTRPVTARVDTSATLRPRNERIGRPVVPPGFPPPPNPRRDREAPRASDPNGPIVYDRDRGFRRPPEPDLATARGHVVEFGKFRGHTLGEIAGFEPSYVDWIASTITRDRDLVAAARVVRDDLDRRGVGRRARSDEATAAP